jgi:hypothetical protein
MQHANTMSQIRKLLELEKHVVTVLLEDIDEEKFTTDDLKKPITTALVLMRDMTSTMTDWVKNVN